MKLSELEAQFVGSGGDGIADAEGKPVPERNGIGIIFNCPKCGADHPGCVEFTNPLDGGPPTRKDGHTWNRQGETIDTLTLTPSILRKDCGWHGFFTNGEVVNA